MVMKDKLVKTNHKGGYYKMKKASVASLVMASAFFACFIPTYLTVNSYNINQQVRADDVKDEKPAEEQKILTFGEYSF